MKARRLLSVGAGPGALGAGSAADARILALVSPTCGTCLLGATTMERDVFAKLSSTRLRGFIVWVPKLGAHQHDVAGATPTVPDPRATHYWDGTGYLVRAYPAVLGLDADAWDVYLIYGQGDPGHGGRGVVAGGQVAGGLGCDAGREQPEGDGDAARRQADRVCRIHRRRCLVLGAAHSALVSEGRAQQPRTRPG